MKWGLLETWRPKIAIPSRMLAVQKKLAGFCSSKARPARKSCWRWKETMSVLSYQEPPAQTEGEVMSVTKAEWKRVFFSFRTQPWVGKAEKNRQ